MMLFLGGLVCGVVLALLALTYLVTTVHKEPS